MVTSLWVSTQKEAKEENSKDKGWKNVESCHLSGRLHGTRKKSGVY